MFACTVDRTQVNIKIRVCDWIAPQLDTSSRFSLSLSTSLSRSHVYLLLSMRACVCVCGMYMRMNACDGYKNTRLEHDSNSDGFVASPRWCVGTVRVHVSSCFIFSVILFWFFFHVQDEAAADASSKKKTCEKYMFCLYYPYILI